MVSSHVGGQEGARGTAMTTLVDKHIQLADEQARMLERLARASGVSESALIEQALELLFVERAATSSSRPTRIDPADTIFVVGTPITAADIVRQGDKP